MSQNVATIQRALLTWFRSNYRSFIWRDTADPWVCLVSEIFLKKTRASRVNDFVPRFVRKYPNPHEVYTTPLDELACDLEPLGLHQQRSVHLNALCRVLVEEFSGRVPDTEDGLRRLPGVGDYIRNAVRCFAFGARVPILDANVVRVLLRVFTVQCSRAEPRRSPEVMAVANSLLPEAASDARAFNLALLDLGALVCLPRNPRCAQCPLVEACNTACLYPQQGSSGVTTR